MRRGINSYCAFGGRQIGAMWERPTSCCSESCTLRKEEEMTGRANAAPTSNDLIKDRQRLDAARRRTEDFHTYQDKTHTCICFRGVTQTQNNPLTLRRNDLCLWLNVHMSQTLLFLHSGERFCTSMCPFLQDLWWKHQYFSIEIKLPYLCGYEPCVAAAPSFHFTADCSHCFFKLHTAPRDKLVCLKYSEGCLPEKSTSSVKKT